jgi:phytoene dehydrogenase-like protein
MASSVESRWRRGADKLDAVVVGSGPNGLAAAITLARRGCAVTVFEAADSPGGGARSAPLTLPGYVHDVGSAVHPLGKASPFFRMLPLKEHGLSWLEPAAPLAHPLDDGTAVMLEHSVEATAASLDAADSGAYRGLMHPLGQDLQRLVNDRRRPRHPLASLRSATRALGAAATVGASLFEGERARSLFAGLAAHSAMSLHQRPSAAVGLALGALGHAVGWPVAGGGSQAITDAMLSYLSVLGGDVVTRTPVHSLDELPRCRAVLFDVAPRELARIAGDHLPERYVARLWRYRHAAGVFKVDWALRGPIPWTATECTRAATVHLGGGFEEIVACEEVVARGGHPTRPFVLLVQASLFDTSRAPEGGHTAWAYCHVPNGSAVDMAGRIEAQVERFAPGFSERIAARSTMGPQELQAANRNLVGGDVTGGSMQMSQFVTRPVARLVPYTTPDKALFLCSSSTPPGPGVHGLCGYLAGIVALRRRLA